MNIELKQVAEQSLDLSTPTLREMVTRHAAVIDSRATLEDMPEALAFQIDMARALLREFTDTQQPATTEPVVSRNPFASRCYTMSESHLSGHRLIVGFEKLGDAQDAHEWVARQGRGDFTHTAPSVPDGYALVPIEPTDEMVSEMLGPFIALNGDNRSAFIEAYPRMLTAAKKETR